MYLLMAHFHIQDHTLRRPFAGAVLRFTIINFLKPYHLHAGMMIGTRRNGINIIPCMNGELMKKKEVPLTKTLYGVVKVSSKGQIIIPADLRKELNIREGDQLYIIKNKNNDIVLLTMQRMEKVFDFSQFGVGAVYDE